MHHYLPRRGLRWANIMGPVTDPQVFDWRDALARLRAAKPKPTSDALIEPLRPGQQLLLMQPIIRTAAWGAPWTKLVRRRAAQWERVPRSRSSACCARWRAPMLAGRPLPRGVRAVLYERK